MVGFSPETRKRKENMSDIVESKDVGRFTVNIVADYDFDLSDAVNCDPVAIYEDGGHVVLDQTESNMPIYSVIMAIADGCAESIMNEMCGYYIEWEWVNGKVRVENSDWNRPRYFKTAESACSTLFEQEYGYPLSDLRVEQFGDYRNTFHLVFLQSKLDRYAGSRGAISCRDTCQNIVDGDVYGFDVLDESGDSVDSCWGFIGDSSYCMSEGLASAEWHERDRIESEALAMANAMTLARPDMYQGTTA